jgi:hypothetical protein
MTEAEWLAADDPKPMLKFLRDSGRASERKLRLFAIACCLGNWSPVYADRCRSLVGLAERYADGQARGAELTEARRIAYPGELLGVIEPDARRAATAVLWSWVVGPGERPKQAAHVRDVFGNPFRPVAADPAWLAWNHGTVRRLAEAAYQERSLPEGTLSNGRLAVLADALEEAGCADADLLGHLRGPGPHVLGCWAVDLLSGRE